MTHMRKSIIIFSITSVFLLVFASLPSTAKMQKTEIKNSILSKYLDEETIEKITENSEEPKWYPGWFIVQLLKGAAALILVLLILLNLVEPEE